MGRVHSIDAGYDLYAMTPSGSRIVAGLLRSARTAA
jgi:hypothetical protein